MNLQPNTLHVYSEIGRLKKVMLHRPSSEIENLTPDWLDRLLFDDIPYLDIAVKEHDSFAKILKDSGVEVVYLNELVSQAISDDNIKKEFIKDFVDESNVSSNNQKEMLKEFLFSMDTKEMILKMMRGVYKEELPKFERKALSDIVNSDYPFVTDPMPNLYFTRDPFSNIGSSVSVNHMYTVTRNRETIFGKYIFKHHKDFKDANINQLYDRTYPYAIEGGDILVLSNEVIAIGISERTQPAAIDEFARNLFATNESFKKIIAIDIPKKRAFMHLDTVFTMIDFDKFTIHPEIEGPMKIYVLTKVDEQNYTVKEEEYELDQILARALNVDKVELIRCGGGDKIAGAREQWNDGANTLAISPGEVIVYERNYVTNRLLEEKGIKIHKMPSSEISRGRGGPRCMSMPFYREDL